MRIALTGVAGSGKSTAAAYYAAHGFKRTRFADPLKNMLRALYETAGLHKLAIEARIEGILKEQPDPLLCGVSPRKAMQTLGTEWRDLIHRDLWTRFWEQTVQDLGDRSITVEDCRFEHEYLAAKKLGFIVVEIIRDGAGTQSKHSSESGIGDHLPDYRVYNNGSLDDLYKGLEAIRWQH